VGISTNGSIRNAGQRLNVQSVLSHKLEFSDSPYRPTPSVV